MQNLELELEEKLSNAESEEEMVRILNEAGYSVTAEQLKAMAETAEGELSEDALEAVGGGLAISMIARVFYKCFNTSRGGGGAGSFGGGGSMGGR